MRRRDFLQGLATTAVGLELLAPGPRASGQSNGSKTHNRTRKMSEAVSVEGYTLVSEFKANADSWKVYEDLRTREGPLVLLSSSGETRVLPKSAEASMPEGSPYLGLALKDVG